uniref:TIR domain-containing protein n=1 Tax=Ascaris lumbricoides TaxID=6252 RepID=A0A0M3ID52_ASCLU
LSCIYRIVDGFSSDDFIDKFTGVALSDSRKSGMNDLWSSLQREATVISRCLNADVRIILACNYDANSGSAKQEMRISEGSSHSMPTSTATAIAAQRSANATDCINPPDANETERNMSVRDRRSDERRF